MAKRITTQTSESIPSPARDRITLPTETAEQFEQVRQLWYNEFPPVNDLERRFLDRLAERDWYLQRAERLYAAAHLRASLDNPDPAQWSQEDWRVLDIIARYRTIADRAWRAALKDIKDLRRYRIEMALLAEKTKRQFYENVCDGVSSARPNPDSNNDEKDDSPDAPKTEKDTEEETAEAEPDQTAYPETRRHNREDDREDDRHDLRRDRPDGAL